MINSIEFKNFKGQAGVQQLTGRDIFIGRNGTGKTTRRQALGLSFLGYIPGEGKTAADTYKFATGESMTVGLKTDAFHFTRTFTREMKNNPKTGESTPSIKESLTVAPGRGEKKETDRKDRIVSEVGSFPVMLDFGEFVSLSDAKRRDFIYGLSSIDSTVWTKESVGRYLEDRLLTLGLKSNNYDQFVVMNELVAQTMEHFPDSYNISDGLQAMLDWVTAEKKLWDGKQKDAQGAVRQFAEMKNELAETDRNIAKLKEELETLRQQLIQAEKVISADEQKAKALKKRQDRIKELQTQIATIEQTSVVNVAEIDVKLTEELAKIQESTDVEQEIVPLTARQKEIRDSIKVVQNQKQEVSNSLALIVSTVKALEAALDATGKLGGKCIIHQMIGCPKDFSGLGDFVAKKKTKADEEKTAIQLQINGFTQQITALEAEESGITAKISDINKQAQKINSENAAVNVAVAKLHLQKTQAESANKDRDNKLKLYQSELTKLQAEPIEAVTGNELLQAQAAGLRKQIADIEKSVSEKEKAKQTVLLLQQSMLENKKSEHKSNCLKLIQEALGPKGIQGELVKGILEPIRCDIRGNLALMGFDHEPFFQTESDTGKEIFQFGWVNERGHYVNFDALSTGQQTIFLAAMMVTIIDRAQPKLRVLVMDDLNHLDRINFQMLIDGLTKIAHKLDNTILAGAIEFPFTAEGWNVSDLSQAVEAKQSA